MPGVKGKSGGPRQPGPGKRLGRPVTTSSDYARLAIPDWNLNEREEAALEWFKGLEPFERLQLIVKMYYS